MFDFLKETDKDVHKILVRVVSANFVGSSAKPSQNSQEKNIRTWVYNLAEQRLKEKKGNNNAD